MRVIAGRFRSRKLKTVPGLAVRPTPDRLRETLFSILSPRIDGAIFIDAYAGSGAVGIEALSRGAKHVFLIERNAQALSVIRENLDSLDITNEVTVLRGRAASLLADHPADIVFLDPPYEKTNEYRESLLALSRARSGADSQSAASRIVGTHASSETYEKSGLSHIRCPYAIAQHASRLTLDSAYENLSKTRVLKQGDNSLSFFELRKRMR
jgi:16S rRNA (guanine966-N2)-methyltransferase